MDTDSNKKAALNRIYFAKLHERVHNKYEEMQRKIEKYKRNNENELNENTTMSRNDCKGVEDLREPEEKSLKTEYLVVEEVEKFDAIPKKVEQLVKYEVESDFTNVNDITGGDFYNSNDNYIMFPNYPFNNSLESLNDEIKNDLSVGLPSPPATSPKLRLRHKIGSRISAAMEKRQREKEKPTYKKKKSDLSSMETYILSNSTKGDLFKMGRRARTATLTIALIDVKGIEELISEDRSNAFYCRFRLGVEKCKSKFAKIAENEIKWLEMFNIPVHDEHVLEITLWDKDNQDCFHGRAVIDTIDLQKEMTHEMRVDLEGATQNAQIFMLLTISGTTLNTIIDIDDYKNTLKEIKHMKGRFAWYHLADDYRDVGCLSVLVYGAKGLAGDDPFCVLELGNTRLQTQTEHKTFDPNWMKIFIFSVKDVTSILVVSVYDENKNKVEIIGKISIPILKITNGKKRWYALKDKSQRKLANGDRPRILLEMNITWNPIKASLRVINPKEQVYMKPDNKLNRHVFSRNIYRSKVIISWVSNAVRVTKECFEWESRTYSFFALIVWLTMCWFFKVWMMPALLLVPFAWYSPRRYKDIFRWKNHEVDESSIMLEDTPEKDEKWSIRETLQNFQEMTLIVQNGIGTFASLGESIKNLVNFTVPYLSWLAAIILATIAVIMYLIPVKYIFMAWAINKFTRKMLRPNRIPNNEILDLLSRVPDDEILLDCQEIPLDKFEDPSISNLSK